MRLVITATALLAIGVEPAFGQDTDVSSDDETIDMIIVTGSRIPRTEFESLQPATVLDSDQLEMRGVISLATALNEQAGFGLPGNTPIDEGGTIFLGQDFVNFLGLGFQRTLTLVNGQRFPTSVSPQALSGGLAVDLNAIPEILVDRVETIAIGGAPIYGSDAIAGTVNVILKDDFEGLDLVTSIGTAPSYNDSGEYKAGMTWGANFADDRGNLVVSAQFTQADGLRYTDRPETSTLAGFEAPEDPMSPFDQQYFDDLVVAVDNNTAFPLLFGDIFFFNVFGNGVPLDINDPSSPFTQFDRSGNLQPFEPGGGTGSVIFQNGGDGLRLTEVFNLRTDLERVNFNAFANYDLTDSLQINAEAWLARSDAFALTNQSAYNSPAFGGLPDNGWGNVGEGPIPILIDNPFLTTATRNSMVAVLDVMHDTDGDGSADPTIDTDGDGLPDAVGFWRGGPLSEVTGPNSTRSKRTVYRGVLGVEGDAHLFDRDFIWDATVTYGRVDSDEYYLDIVQPRFEQAIQVIAGPGGQPACLDPSGGCVPLDVIGTPSQEAIDYVSSTVIDEVRVEQRVFTANVAGDVFELPAGSVGAAAGFSYRDERATYDPNELAENGFTRFGQVVVDGQFDSTEFYVETVIPLLGGNLDTSWVESLEFEGAVRFVNNSVAGSDTTWTAGLRYRPVEDMELRGNLTESIRAPSINELFTPETQAFVFANDPCDARFINQGNVPDRRAANCNADGIVQPFTSFVVNASQPGTLSGNPNLNSEIAESATFGVILRPRFIENFTASFDWFDIEITNAIENLNAEDILVACYDSAAFPAEPACGLFDRDAAGQLDGIRTGFVNVGLVEFTGLQSVMTYSLDMDRLGSLTLNLNHMYTEKHIETPGSGNAVRLDGEIGNSENRVNLSGIWSHLDWSVFAQLRWLSSAVFDNTDDESTRDIPGVGDWYMLDMGVSYDWNENWRFQLNFDNILDRDPPFAALASFDGVRAYYPGVRGRYVTLRAQGSF